MKKPVGTGLRGGKRRKLSTGGDDELAPLWEDLAASIRKATHGSYQKDKHMVPVYRVVRRDGNDWTD
jgi:hypothetical protein